MKISIKSSQSESSTSPPSQSSAPSATQAAKPGSSPTSANGSRPTFDRNTISPPYPQSILSNRSSVVAASASQSPQNASSTKRPWWKSTPMSLPSGTRCSIAKTAHGSQTAS